MTVAAATTAIRVGSSLNQRHNMTASTTPRSGGHPPFDRVHRREESSFPVTPRPSWRIPGCRPARQRRRPSATGVVRPQAQATQPLRRLFAVPRGGRSAPSARSDDHAECHSAHGSGKAQLCTEYFRRHHDGQRVDGRARVEECRGRAKSCAHPVDAREQRQRRPPATARMVPETDPTP